MYAVRMSDETREIRQVMGKGMKINVTILYNIDTPSASFYFPDDNFQNGFALVFDDSF
jgi:hypothetical protein